MKAEVHAPINYRNYFNGHFNKHFKGTLRNTGTSVQWNINHLEQPVVRRSHVEVEESIHQRWPIWRQDTHSYLLSLATSLPLGRTRNDR